LNGEHENLSLETQSDPSFTSKKNEITIEICTKINRIREEGKLAFRKGDYKEACERFTMAIDASRDTTKVCPMSAKNENPFAVFDNLLQPLSVPIDPLLLVNRALCYFKLGKYENCISDCNDALLIDEKCVKALYRKGEAYRQQLKFLEAKVILKQCESILKENPALQNQVSFKIVSQTIHELELLSKDERIAGLEKESLLKSPQALLLKEMLDSMTDNASLDPSGKLKVAQAIIYLLDSHISMRHAFRLLQGFDRALCLPTENLFCIIIAACKDTEENLRFLCQKVETILPILASSDSIRALACFLELQNHYPPLATQFAKPRSINTNIGHLIYKGIHEAPENDKYHFYRFLNMNLDKLTLKTLWNLNLEKCVMSAAKELETASLQSIWIECVNFLYSITVHSSEKAETAVVVNSSRLVKGIGYFLFNHASVSEEITEKALAVLLNTLVRGDCDRQSILEETRLVSTILAKMKIHYRMCLKILAKLSIKNPKSINPFCNQLEWDRCHTLLSGELNSSTRSEIGDWLQLVLVRVKLSQDNLREFLEENGLETLLVLLDKCSRDPVPNERILANTALILSTVLDRESEQERTVALGGLELIINLIRKMHDKSKVVGKNLAICCAKLYQNGTRN
jgi:hypothetical protein